MNRDDICNVRQKTLGLSACADCPANCSVKDENGNRLSNVLTAYPEAFPDFTEEITPAKKAEEDF